MVEGTGRVAAEVAEPRQAARQGRLAPPFQFDERGEQRILDTIAAYEKTSGRRLPPTAPDIAPSRRRVREGASSHPQRQRTP